MSSAVLEVRGATKLFGRFAALSGVDLTVEQGEVRALIGPNGAGKTTLTNVISGLIRLDKGRVLLHGEDITAKSPERIAKRGLMRTFQLGSLFPEMSVRENLEVALIASRRRRERYAAVSGLPTAVPDLLALFGLERFETVRADTLSHGDARSLELAMALVPQPGLLILDEPTAGMSAAETRRTTELIGEELRGRVTIIIIEHDMNVVMRLADRITVLAEGQVLAEGTSAEIKLNKEVRDVYFGSAATN